VSYGAPIMAPPKTPDARIAVLRKSSVSKDALMV
jgi:hypothetical protein